MRGVLVALTLLVPAVAHGQFVPMPPPDRYVLAVALTEQLQGCWVIPDGFSGTDIVVDLLVAPDGILVGEADFSAIPEADADRYAPLIASIRRATQRCAPFSAVAAAGGDADLPVRVTFVVP